MPFTAHDLRYKAEETYPALYAHLSRHAQRFLRSLQFDAFELDIVVDHVVEQLVRMGLLGGADQTPLTALDRLNNAQFYAFLNRSIRNKAIDRLRKRRLPVSSIAELETMEGIEGEDDRLNEAVESLWGPAPFSTPEEIALTLTSQQELRDLLKHCIKELSAAPRQLQAVLGELEEFDAVELLQGVITELKDSNLPVAMETPFPHSSQHKDHAHKKLRHCLQESSTNLTVMIALRLTKYGAHSTGSDEFFVDIQTLAQDDLSESDVRTGLNQLIAEGLLEKNDGNVVRITSAQMKRLTRFYKDE
ncbi:MAG: hypothetical protein NVS4B7_08320 [Ktedonobacteraceae bacterium]